MHGIQYLVHMESLGMAENMSEREYKMCKRCVMDTTDPDIVFDEDGICNHCKAYEQKLKIANAVTQEDKYKYLKTMLEKIRKDGNGKEYDCLIGFSGGADSTFVVDWAHRMRLRAVLVTIDDGWGIPETMRNIERVAEKCKFPLEVWKIDEEEINDLYRAFLKANVIDIEMPIDHLLQAVFIESAKAWGTKYILTGSNIQTEGIMPKSWAFNKQDAKNIKAIHKRFSTMKLKSYFTISPWKLYWYRLTKKFHYFKPLWHLDYNREEAVKGFQEKYGWEPYEKNSETVFTRFDKRVILRCKFGVEKIR